MKSSRQILRTTPTSSEAVKFRRGLWSQITCHFNHRDRCFDLIYFLKKVVDVAEVTGGHSFKQYSNLLHLFITIVSKFRPKFSLFNPLASFDLSYLKKGPTNVFQNYIKSQYLLQKLKLRIICLRSPLLNLMASAEVGKILLWWVTTVTRTH